MSDPAARIDLAHESPFALGRLTVRPPTREVMRDDGQVEVLEPRVMQVLVALHRAGGAILSRDDLTRSCWKGRVVGEDAINRVISRLRRTAERIGERSFRIETVTKVGYRLVGVAETADAGISPPPASRLPDRRMILAGGAALAVAGTGALLWPRARPAPPPDPRIGAMMQAGYAASSQTTGDGYLQARGIFRRVTQLAPNFAEGWAALGMIYAVQWHYQLPEQTADLLARAREAIARARVLEPDSPRAATAEATLLPYNRWGEIERRLRAILDRHPDDDWALALLGRNMARVGRMGEAADLLVRAVAKVEASPVNMFDLMNWQWAAGRNEAADRTSANAIALFPRNFSVWFGSFYLRLFSGRVDDAITMAQDVALRPATISMRRWSGRSCSRAWSRAGRPAPSGRRATGCLPTRPGRPVMPRTPCSFFPHWDWPTTR